MTSESQQKRRRVVVAPPAAILSVVVTLVLAGVGARLIVTASSPVGMSIGIAVLWVAVNVLIVGLVSSSAWRRRRIVVGGEKVDPGTVAESTRWSGRRHGVVLRTPGTSVVRTLHGFTTQSGPGAERLAERLNTLIRVAVVAAEEPDPDSWMGIATVPMPQDRSDAEPEDGPGAEDAIGDDTATVLLRRGLPLMAGGGFYDEAADDATDGPARGAPAADDTVVLPRRGRAE